MNSTNSILFDYYLIFTLFIYENISNKSYHYKRDAQNHEIKTIVLGLFALIGFIILIAATFMPVIGESFASVTDTVFVAATIGIGCFTLEGSIVARIFLKKFFLMRS